MKRICTIILAIILVVSIAIPSMAVDEGLRDLDDSKYKVEIEKLVEDGTISGYTDGTFRPKNGITRGELAKIFAVTLNLEENKDAAKHFVDVKGKWNQGCIGALYEAKIMIGVSEDKFGESKNVTREELAVILLRIFELEDIANEMAFDVEFKDANQISDWAKNAVGFISKIGLMNGIENEDSSLKFLPKALGERELVAKLVYELKYNKETYEEIIETLKKPVDAEKPEPQEETHKEEEPEEEIPKEEESKDEKTTENKPSYDSIVSKYYSQLSSLESSVSSQLSSLISQAEEEYKNGVSASEIKEKYMSKVSALEASTDAQVSSILSSLSSELSANGYDTSVVAEFQAQYEEAKAAAIESL